MIHDRNADKGSAPYVPQVAVATAVNLTQSTRKGTVKTISLYYRQGSSDKEYHAQVEPKGSG